MMSPGAPPQTMDGGLRTVDRPAQEQGSIAPSLDKIIFLSYGVALQAVKIARNAARHRPCSRNRKQALDFHEYTGF
jgi:hypothetical protein